MRILRPEYLQKLIQWKDKDLIKVVTGVRRCGKSVLLFDLFYEYLLQQGTDAEHIIRINLENLDQIENRNRLNLYKTIKSLRQDDGKYYVFLDEIQYVDGFEDLLNTLRNEGCDVYVTGSNSKLLSRDISTSLRGRMIEIRVHTLSFAEFYAYRGGDTRKAFFEYMLYGGFPAAVLENNLENKSNYLGMLERTVAVKDIIERYKIRHESVFTAVYDFLCSNIGSLVSAKKIADTLRSNGFQSVSPDTIGNYLEYLCNAFLFTKVYRYDVKGKEYLKTLNKYYISDLGLRNAHLNYRQVEPTHALENLVYQELLYRGWRVDIGKNNQKEIDFVVTKGTEKMYIQVAYSIVDPEKKEQELSSFRGLDDGFQKLVLTMDDDPFNQLAHGYVKKNVIDWLLNK